MNFIINDFTTINNFKRLAKFETIKKFGEDYEYERFVGEIKNQKVTGLICLEDENIYNLKELS